MIVLGLLSNSIQAQDLSAPSTVFQDCPTCPEMVVLPSGEFTMGSPEDELGRQPDEGPLHQVTFAKPFAISRFHVTVEEWNTYTKETGVTLKDGDSRPGRECIAGTPRYEQTPRHPAVCIDFHDVRNYIEWLAQKTGKPYRMLSEAEREYAARAGSSGPFPFPFDEDGEYQISKHANTYGPRDGFSYVAPVGSFPANAFGAYDMHGNVYEWIEDCYHNSYNGAHSDGKARLTGECNLRVIRGNDWIEPPIFSRSGNRNERAPDIRGDWLGFRVAREL
ncbi:formylglycine-generating enzyme family protein [Pseudomonas sp. ABC1]|uniref:formylglycine-generating enzyme family protein n=1 Tax=Pseudomonas sp. ABC1 TaxID=2748080 RepID=UPI00358EE6B5